MKTLWGREEELHALRSLVDLLPTQGAALVLRGEAGIGKSSLLASLAAEADARGLRVVSVAGAQTEFAMPFAGLTALLRRLGDEAVAGVEQPGTTRTEPYQVAVAALRALVAAATDRPLVMLIDDAQWLDRPSWDALTFVGRRLDDDPIIMLLSLRDGEEAAQRLAQAGLREMRVPALAPDEAEALVDELTPGLAPDLRARVLAEAAGNPLGLVELAGVAARSGMGGLLPGSLPLSTRLERTFGDVIRHLPDVTRSLVLVAALNESDGLDEMLAATTRIEGVPATLADIEPAISAGVTSVDEEFRVHFRHPLVRSAVTQAASLTQRSSVHLGLAAVIPDVDRRIWHRAAATFGKDENLARELDDVARRANSRGARATAIAAWEKAAQLTVPGQDRTGRLVQAAMAAGDHGDRVTLQRVLHSAEGQDMRAADRTWVAWLREVYLDVGWSGASRLLASVEIAEQMYRDGDAKTAMEMLAAVSLRAAWSNPDEHIRREFIAAAERLGFPALDPQLVFVLATVAPVERGADAMERMSQLVTQLGIEPTYLHLLGTAAVTIGAFDMASVFISGSIAGLREQGQLGQLAQALVTQAWLAAVLGDTIVGLTAATEAHALAMETGQPLWGLVAELGRACVAGLRGDGTTAVRLAEEGERVLLSFGIHPMLSLVMQARGIAALAGGRHEEAFDHLHRIFDPADIAFHPTNRFRCLGMLADAGVRCGRLDPVRALTAQLEPLSVNAGSPALRIGLAYASAVLADEDEAEALFHDALAADLAGWPFERARLQLAYGTWLRRRRRPSDARSPLRAAMTTFDALGTVPWADNARRELQASGETVRRPDDARDQLTPQEVQIAQLAAEGLSNRDIATRLFLSPRTVGSHLYRIYPKLGISSRAELARLMVGRGS